MKKIYEFVLPHTEEVEESTTEQKDGKEVTTTTKVEKSVDKKFFLKRPTRKLFDEAELFYGVKLSEGIKAGLLTRALLSKRFSNDGGILSDTEKEEFGKLYSDLFDKQVELQQLNIKTASERTAEENEKHKDVTEFLSNARKRIQEFEMSQSSLYDQTAENRARNKTILWWVLFLSYYVDDNDKELPFFGDGDYSGRLDKYDELDEKEEDFSLETINKFFYYVSFWYVSKTSDPEQFKELIKFAEQADLGEDLSPAHEPTDVEFESDIEDPDEEKENTEEAPAEEAPAEEAPAEEAPAEEAPAEEAPEEKASEEEASAEDKANE
jgi:hypothetical protein